MEASSSHNKARKRLLKTNEEQKTKLPRKQAEAPVKLEPADDFGKGDNTTNCPTPILTSIISTPPSSPSNSKNSDLTSNQTFNYLTIFAAFRQFLSGYLQAGGDASLVNALANYAAVLPMPPNPLKPLGPLGTIPLFQGDTQPIEQLSSSTLQSHQLPVVKSELEAEPETSLETDPSTKLTLSAALGECESSKNQDNEESTDAKPQIQEAKTALHSLMPHFPVLPLLQSSQPVPEAVSEIQRLREAAFGRYKNVLCVICNEWICSRNRKNHIEAHLNYRPYKCSACNYARRREIFVIQHIKSQHKGVEGVEMLSAVDLHVAIEVDRLADECVMRTRKLIENMQEKKDGDFGENKDFDEKALELMLAEEAEKKVVVIESVSEVRPKVANYHRRQRTKVLKKIYDTDASKQAELKIIKEEDGGMPMTSIKLKEGFEIKLEDLMKMVEAGNPIAESNCSEHEGAKEELSGQQ